ncbi:MAG: hypothetical protein QE263_04275 [Vampirovibrionales bacterium]|nr:hypothetical protein [Vampirovibrionales bacterium]
MAILIIKGCYTITLLFSNVVYLAARIFLCVLTTRRPVFPPPSIKFGAKDKLIYVIEKVGGPEHERLQEKAAPLTNQPGVKAVIVDGNSVQVARNGTVSTYLGGTKDEALDRALERDPKRHGS